MLGFAQAKSKTSQATSAIANIGKGAMAAAGAAATAIGIAAAIAAPAVIALAHSFNDIDRQAKLADRLGISMQSMQKLGMAADLAGADVEVLTKAMLKMGTFATDNKSAAVFKQLGVSAKTAAGQVKPLDALFFEVADAIAGVENPAKRAEMAMEVFGKGGIEILNVLMAGGKGIRESAAAIDRFGLALSRADASKIEAANDAITVLSSVLSGIVNKLAVELAPTVERLANSMVDAMERFGKSLDSVNIKWKTFGEYFELWGDLLTNGGPPKNWSESLLDILGPARGILEFIHRPPGTTPPPKPATGANTPDIFAEASKKAAPKPSALEFNSVEAVRAVQNAGGDGTSAIVAELKKVVRAIQVSADDTRRGSLDEDGIVFREGRL